MCSGTTRGRVLNGEFYAQRFQKLIYLHLFTDCFHEEFSSIIVTNTVFTNTNTVFVPTIEEKSS